MDPLLLAGKTLRIRGWVGGDTAPTIILTDPHQIEGVEQLPLAAYVNFPQRSEG
jgi:hypothetical protein